MTSADKQPQCLRLGDLILDAGTKQVTRDGNEIALPKLSFDLLQALAEAAPNLVTIDELIDKVWAGAVVSPETVMQRVKLLRDALGDDSHEPRYVALVRGRGYRLIARVGPYDPSQRRADYLILAALALVVVGVVSYGLAERILTTPVTIESETSTSKIPLKSIAVLPFKNLSTGADGADVFASGIHSDLITQLTKLESLDRVIARRSVLRYRDSTNTLPVIGGELGVNALLLGEIQKAGDAIRVNVSLVQARTEAILWAESYDRQLTAANVFAIQREITNAIAKSLQVTLSLEDQRRIAAIPTQNLAALEAYFIGKDRMAQRTTEALTQAVNYFQQAIELDPSFALAHVRLADAYILLGLYSDEPPNQELLERIRVAAQTALELDARLGEAYTVLAAYSEMRGDYDAADVFFQRAIDLSPNYAVAYQWYAEFLRGRLGDAAGASPYFEKALELDPLSPIIQVSAGLNYEYLGEYDEAMLRIRKAIDINPDFAYAYSRIARLYAFAKGRFDLAIPWLRRAVSLDQGNPEYCEMLTLIWLNLGDEVRAEEWVDRCLALGEDKFWANYAMLLLEVYRLEGSDIHIHTLRLLELAPSRLDQALVVRLIVSLPPKMGTQVGPDDEFLAFYNDRYPELFGDELLEVNRFNYAPAILLFRHLLQQGAQERADILAEHTLAFLSSQPRLSFYGHHIADVEIYALQGNHEKALALLRQAIDAGWRNYWWLAEHNPNLDLIRNEPEFQVMLKEVEADMAAQLMRVREMEASGEIELLSEPVRH
ncbi:MAG: winged helix-turn-helix domain-containing protein [Proteobacteria bacterium]|nr:winged helix-turn-helix domain-containing protein [Pseudomonadota bacterium]